MSFTRFNYDNARVSKQLQESTGPGRWVLNTPGQGLTPFYYEDPQVRLQKHGGNLHLNPIDISSDLQGRNTKLNRDNVNVLQNMKHYTKEKQNFPNMKAYTNETRVTHPVFVYRNKESTRWEYPLLDPQEPVMYSQNVQSTSSRILQKNVFVPKL